MRNEKSSEEQYKAQTEQYGERGTEAFHKSSIQNVTNTWNQPEQNGE